MSRPFLDVETEDRLLDEVAQRRIRTHAAVQAATPAWARLAGQYAAAYPWLDPGVIQSFTMAGLPADDPTVVEIATGIGAQLAQEDGKFDAPAEEMPDAWYEKLADFALGWAKPIVRHRAYRVDDALGRIAGARIVRSGGPIR